MVAPFSTLNENLFSQRFHFKTNRKNKSSSTTAFQNSPIFQKLACFYVTIKGNFQRFQYFNFETNFLETKRKPFSKNWSTAFKLKVLTLKTQHFDRKLPCQKRMLRQMEKGIQKGHITKKRALSVTTLSFLNLLKRVNLTQQLPKCPYSCFSWALEFHLKVVFSRCVSLKYTGRGLSVVRMFPFCLEGCVFNLWFALLSTQQRESH